MVANGNYKMCDILKMAERRVKRGKISTSEDKNLVCAWYFWLSSVQGHFEVIYLKKMLGFGSETDLH